MIEAEALHMATLAGNEAAVQLVLAAEPTATTAADAKGQLPLHIAAVAMHGSVCRLLLQAAPSAVLARDAHGQTPLDVCLASLVRFSAAGHMAPVFRHRPDPAGRSTTATAGVLLDAMPLAAALTALAQHPGLNAPL